MNYTYLNIHSFFDVLNNTYPFTNKNTGKILPKCEVIGKNL